MDDRLEFVDGRLLDFFYTEETYDTRDGEPLKKELFEFGDYKDFGKDKNDYMELLAPVSVSSYKQAVYGGATAVYFGYKEWNARAGAENFDDMKALVDFCHFHFVKAYLALNICFKNAEIPQVLKVIEEAEKANIDAFIITDLALLSHLNDNYSVQIHASTQLGVHNVWGRQFMRDLRLDRVILSREMNFSDIRKVTDLSSVDTEVFIHGALCSCFSGACLLSSMLTGGSANRGKCNQLCRRQYTAVVDGKPFYKGYLLSAKDICLDEHVLELADIGVASLKIEGRLKRPEYVGGVTAYYSDLKLRKEPIFTRDDVKVLFNRGGFTPGYFKNNSIIYTGQPNHIGIYKGKVVHLVNDYEAYVKSAEPLQENDGYKVLRNMVEMGGAIATGTVVKGFSVIKTNFKLKVGDVIRLTSDDVLGTFILNRKFRKNVPIRVRLVCGERPEVVMNLMGQDFTYGGQETILPAMRYPLTEEEIYDLLEGSRVRDVRFIIVDLELQNAFMTKAQLNALRRDLIDTAWSFILGYYERRMRLFRRREPMRYRENVTGHVSGDFCEIDCVEKLRAVKKIPNIVYSPTTFVLDEAKIFYQQAKTEKNKVFIKLPVYVPTAHEEFFEEFVKVFDGVLANNVGGIYVAHKYGKLAVGGPSLNIMNTRTWFAKNTASYVLSPELKYSEIKNLKDAMIYTYGYLPLIVLNYCPRRLAGMDCSDCNKELRFRDEKGDYLITTQHFNGYCEHVLHNDRLTDIGNTYKVRHYFDFTLTKESVMRKTLALYYGKEPYKPTDTNKLHLLRGV